MKPLMLCFCLLPMAAAPAEEVRLQWMNAGMYSKVHYQAPVVTKFLQQQPAQIVKVPEGLVDPQYVLLETGPRAQRKLVGLILDQRTPREAHLWVDANGDGDLTNDPEAKWVSAARGPEGREIISWHGEASVQITYPDSTQQMGLVFYRNGSSSGPGPLIYHRDYGRQGKVSVGGREMDVYLSDDTTTGEFTPERTRLILDMNGDHRIDPRAELFQFDRPLVLQGSVYETKNLSPDGSRFELVPSALSVAQVEEEKKSRAAAQMAGRRKAQEGEIGKPAPSFEAKTIDGKTVRFPEDYKGKLVMLDFWATWCGPCLHELPGLVKAHEEFAPQGFTVLSVSLDHDEDVATLPEFVKARNMNWPQICDGKSRQSDIVRQYGVNGIPACWLVDGDTGRILATSVDLRGEALRETLAKALAAKGFGKAPAPMATIPPNAEKAEREDLASNSLVDRLQKLAAKEGLMSAQALQSQLAHPTPARLNLATPLNTPLRGREIAKRAAEAHVRVGWVYQCTKCSRWHTRMAGGFAITPDVVVTARHVMAPPPGMSAGHGHPVIMRGEDEIISISSVLYADERADTVVLRVTAQDLKPLALTRDVQVGDDAYCFSDPLDVLGHFSTGMVNRMHPARGADDPNNPLLQRMDVSADWASGSSGAAILDAYGNAIGHVARIRPLLGTPLASEAGNGKATIPTLMTLNEAIPASVVLSLIGKDSQ